MNIKTIKLAQDSHEILSELKQTHKNFDNAVQRITPKRPITDFAGILSKEEAKDWKREINSGRKKSRKREKQLRENW